MNEIYRYLSIDIVDGDTTKGASFTSDQRSKPSVEKGLSHYFECDVREVKCEKCSVGTHATETLFVSERYVSYSEGILLISSQATPGASICLARLVPVGPVFYYFT
jgi:hypothetical protein